MTSKVISPQKSTTVRSWLSPIRLSSPVINAFPRVSGAFLTARFLTPWRRMAPLSAAGSDSTHLFEVDGKALVAHVWGLGPLVVLVHGWSGAGSQLQGLRETLVEHGYRVAVFDAPAHGGAGGKRANAGLFKRAIESLIDTLGSAKAVVGHSLGGLAAAMAREAIGVDRLVLIAPMPSFDFALDEFQRFLGCSDEVRESVGARIERIAGVTRDQARLDRLLASRDKTLVIHDAADRQVPVEGVRALASLPSVEYVETRGLGHKRVLDSAGVQRRVVEFLAN